VADQPEPRFTGRSGARRTSRRYRRRRRYRTAPHRAGAARVQRIQIEADEEDVGLIRASNGGVRTFDVGGRRLRRRGSISSRSRLVELALGVLRHVACARNHCDRDGSEQLAADHEHELGRIAVLSRWL
jgi:hypothetical protein